MHIKNYLSALLFFGLLNPLQLNAQSFISEDRFITVNGIPVWLTIHGEKSKPVILFPHGGPGSPMSPYSDNVYKSWEKDFIVVQWDQRGTGKTYGVHAPAELDPVYVKANSLTVNQMTDDGIKLTEYLLHYLGKQQLILFGSSWGSVLGVSMAHRRPDLYYAYVGHAQMVDPVSNFPLIFKRVTQMVKEENDSVSAGILNKLGPPPYDSARNYGQLLRVVKKLEKRHADPAPDYFWTVASFYNNTKDEKDREDGDDYSFLCFTGDRRFGIPSMMETIHFSTTDTAFRIPIYFLQGQEDILTDKVSTKAYFDKFTAPKKEYILISGAAHGFNQAVINAQYKIMKEIPLSFPPVK